MPPVLVRVDPARVDVLLRRIPFGKTIRRLIMVRWLLILGAVFVFFGSSLGGLFGGTVA